MLRFRGPKEGDGLVNRAVLVYVAQFYPGVGLGNRPGAERDAKRLHRILRKLGYEVELHKDLSSGEIDQLFRRESQRPVKDCFLAVLSSHGEEGCVFGADGNAVQLSRIFSSFDNKNMEEKTKVFLVQACRGRCLDDGVEVDSGGGLGDSEDLSFLQCLSLPVDSTVMYATAPGYAAFMHPLGSVFLQTFCDLLEDRNSKNLELTRLMTRLSQRVAYNFQAKGRELGGKKMMPCLVTRLTRDAFLFAELRKEGEALGINARSLVAIDVDRKRSPSIS
ncbi:unnamed protein product [Ophioblennius macclurei]